MKKTNKKLHAWAKENNCRIWELRKKFFWQFNDEPNATYKLANNFMVTFNGYMVIEDGAYEIYDATEKLNILVTEHGVVNIEKSKGDWQMYRR